MAAAPVSIAIEYLDTGIDQFSLQYLDDQRTSQTKRVTKTNSKKWQTVQWSIPAEQISWNQGLPGGADLVIDCQCSDASGDDIFHMVRVTAEQSPVKIRPSNDLGYCTTDRCQTYPDLNKDGVTNLVDVSVLLTALSTSSTQPLYDLNCDTSVEIADLQALFGRLRW